MKTEKCNCHEWAEIGTYLCPVHGHHNQYRRGGEMKPEPKPEIIFRSDTILRRKYNDLKAENKVLLKQNKYLRNQQNALITRQNELILELTKSRRLNEVCDG